MVTQPVGQPLGQAPLCQSEEDLINSEDSLDDLTPVDDIWLDHDPFDTTDSLKPCATPHLPLTNSKEEEEGPSLTLKNDLDVGVSELDSCKSKSQVRFWTS